jgi:hypothetical protein
MSACISLNTAITQIVAAFDTLKKSNNATISTIKTLPLIINLNKSGGKKQKGGTPNPSKPNPTLCVNPIEKTEKDLEAMLKIVLETLAKNEKYKNQNALSLIRLMSISKYLYESKKVITRNQSIQPAAAILALLEKLQKTEDQKLNCNIYIRTSTTNKEYVNISSPLSNRDKLLQTLMENLIHNKSETQTKTEAEKELQTFITKIKNELTLENGETELCLSNISIYITTDIGQTFFTVDKVIYMYNTICYTNDTEDTFEQGIEYSDEKFYIVNKSFYIDEEEGSGQSWHKEELNPKITNQQLREELYAIRPNENKWAFNELVNVITHISEIIKLTANAKKNAAEKDAAADAAKATHQGGSNLINILGRYRKIISKGGRANYVRYNNELITLTAAKKLNKIKKIK